MGWKTFKEHFRIEHVVHIQEGHLCIGSYYVPDIVEIDLQTGERTGDEEFLKRNYPDLFNAKALDVLKLIQQEDVFENLIDVYLVLGQKGPKIFSKKCEKIGYPHSTTDGVLMYENTTFKTRKEAVNYCIKNLKYVISFHKECVNKAKKEIAESENMIKHYSEELDVYKKEIK